MTVPRTIIGLDLGQAVDPSALALLTESGKDEKNRTIWNVPELKRWPLGTSYLNIAKDVKEACTKLEMQYIPLADPRQVELVVDATGVGRAVVDIFRAASLPVKTLVEVTITAGSAVTHQPRAGVPQCWHVAKKELCSGIQTVLQSRRLRVNKRLKEAAELVKELQTFKIKITAASNETLEAWRESDKDDIVLACCLAAWWGERQRRQARAVFIPFEPAAQNTDDGPWEQGLSWNKW